MKLSRHFEKKKCHVPFALTGYLLAMLFLIIPNSLFGQNKREFRGAWIQCVNGQYIGKSTREIQSMLTKQLDELQQDGVNAIIFQVRAECDALYKSDIEPWSKFLTGVQGKLFINI